MSTLILKNVRLAFPNIWEADPTYGKFGASLIMEPGSDADNLVRAEVEKVLQSKWNGKLTREQLKQFCYKDGSEKTQYEGFEGMKYVSTSSDAQPSVVDRDGRTPLTKASGKIYPGCRVVAYVQIWPQDNQWGKGINAALLGLQFYADDESFGGSRRMSNEEFISFDDEEPKSSGGLFS